jgi:hypothetical protein
MLIFCVESFEMCDGIASGQITVLDQRPFIKIDTLHGCMLTEIYEL